MKTSQYGNIMYVRVCDEDQVLLFRRKCLFWPLYDSCDSWPRSQLPSCVFAPLPIQHYPKPSAPAAQHNHGELPLVDAESAFQQVNSHCCRVNLQQNGKVFHTLPKTPSNCVI